MCVHHPERNIRTLPRGDDSGNAGARADLDWLQAELEQVYEEWLHDGANNVESYCVLDQGGV